MQVNHVFILAAGKGTRMGSIGKVLPKLLWPVFEIPLLDLQVRFSMKHFPGARISINTYNYSELIKSHVNKSSYRDSVDLVVEKETLDIGGAIHNMAKRKDYEGLAAILNGDQFLMLDQTEIEKGIESASRSTACLLGYRVNSNQLYNALSFNQKGKLETIRPNSDIARNTSMVTYTGNSFINLSRLRPTEGESKFFDSIANPELDEVNVEVLADLEYWDFGTLNRYHKSHFDLLMSKSLFFDFLTQEKAIDRNKLKDRSYHSLSGINLAENFQDYLGAETIALSELAPSIAKEDPRKRIIFNDRVELLP
ncbi:MAG: hypothetical protein CME65_11920 [Halobacteriovoraceae bacterium]|nr:hypothetical protein [Halobacteriovoraceae bacterium]|tara:strand:- start:846 stop:1775 length:930 start_codon:yes stop_codon:yes gene_type:complete